MVKKLEGVRLGRPPGTSKKKTPVINDLDKINEEISNGATITGVARKYGIHRNTLRRYLNSSKW